MSDIKFAITKLLPDKLYLSLRFRSRFGRFPNFKSPTTFNEKLQWLKLYDRNSAYTTMVDKYEAKIYVSRILGEEYIIPTLGVWTKFEEIDFDSLPSQFVLKCTHDSGGLVICKDKSKLDIDNAREKINQSLKRNFYYIGREWPYKNVVPRIIAEQYMDDNGHVPIDYKIYCFNGKPYKVMLCLDRDKDSPTKFYSFDREWNLLRHNNLGKEAPEDFTLPQPINLKKMFEFAEVLSKDIPFVRVDFYEVSGQLYFGELTFYPDSGFDNAILPEIDSLYGSMIKLPK